ncbi:MAG: rhodanese-like domain-containing protein [Deltaproteobacteria bacterium]|jgi:rhodanese-related sulfurtransferase|nr:rhodanese-like domain-containing protein [Deltaproteobacteria bacterium]
MFETLKNIFTPVESMTADEARSFISSHSEGSYTLLDVRQPSEYERSHIPGATLIPVASLSDRYKELSPNKPTIVY